MSAQHKKEASDLYDEIALLIAGHRTAAGIEALTRALANIIGFAFPSREEAGEFCAQTCYDMVRLIDANWDDLRAARACVDAPAANA